MNLWMRYAAMTAVILLLCCGCGKDLAAKETLPPSSAPASAESSSLNEPIETSTDYFSTARQNRQQARDSASKMLQETLNSGASEDVIKADAEAAIETLATITISEAKIENLVIAKGYADDCIAFISEGGVSVVVSAEEELQDVDIAQITGIVMEETGVPASFIEVIEVED